MTPTRDQVLFWFGWHYDQLDHSFRKKRWADPVAIQVFTVNPPRAFGAKPPWEENYYLAEVHYNTETMTFLRVKCGNDISVELSDWKL